MDTRWSRSSLLCLVCLAVLGDARAAEGNFSLQHAVIIVACIAFIYTVVFVVLFFVLCRVVDMKCCRHGKVCPISSSTKEKEKSKKREYIEIAGTKGLGKSTSPTLVLRKDLECIPEEDTDGNVFENLAYEKDPEESSSLSDSNNTSRNMSSRHLRSAATVITNLEADEDFVPSSPIDGESPVTFI